MRELTLDMERLRERRAAQEYLKELFGFPDYYGMNLDALRDCLTELTDTQVTVINLDAAEGYPYPSRVLRVLTDAASEDPSLTVLLPDGNTK